MSYTPTAWTDRAAPDITAGKLNNLETGIAEAGRAAVVTTLPGSPGEGQVVDLLVDQAKGIVWRVKYRGKNPDGSDNTSAYKWEFVGGADLFDEVTSQDSTPSATTYVSLTNIGPQVWLPTGIGGDFDVEIGAMMNVGAAQAPARMAYDIFGAATIAASDADSVFFQEPNVATPNGWSSDARLRRKTGVQAGANILAKYKAVNTGTTATFANRWMRVRPVRIG